MQIPVLLLCFRRWTTGWKRDIPQLRQRHSVSSGAAAQRRTGPLVLIFVQSRANLPYRICAIGFVAIQIPYRARNRSATVLDCRLCPVVPARGNHEPNREIIDRLFELKDPKNYFVMNVGGDLMRVYVLNSDIQYRKRPNRRHTSRRDAGANQTTKDRPAAEPRYKIQGRCILQAVPAAHRKTGRKRLHVRSVGTAVF